MSTTPPTAFETERLIARPWCLADAEAAFAMYGDPEVVRYIGSAPEPDPAAMRAKLALIIERTRRLPPGQGSFPCFARDDGRLVGSALIKPLPDAQDRPSGDVEIGWHLLRREWGNGYATEMGRALLAHGFGELGLERLHAVVEPPNLASQAVARRLGMLEQGCTTRYYGGIELVHFTRDARD